MKSQEIPEQKLSTQTDNHIGNLRKIWCHYDTLVILVVRKLFHDEFFHRVTLLPTLVTPLKTESSSIGQYYPTKTR